VRVRKKRKGGLSLHGEKGRSRRSAEGGTTKIVGEKGEPKSLLGAGVLRVLAVDIERLSTNKERNVRTGGRRNRPPAPSIKGRTAKNNVRSAGESSDSSGQINTKTPDGCGTPGGNRRRSERSNPGCLPILCSAVGDSVSTSSSGVRVKLELPPGHMGRCSERKVCFRQQARGDIPKETQKPARRRWRVEDPRKSLDRFDERVKTGDQGTRSGSDPSRKKRGEVLLDTNLRMQKSLREEKRGGKGISSAETSFGTREGVDSDITNVAGKTKKQGGEEKYLNRVEEITCREGRKVVKERQVLPIARPSRLEGPVS